MKTICLVLPTLNPKPHQQEFLRRLQAQKFPAEVQLQVVVVDSASTDGTLEGWKGFEVLPIERKDFNHGGTRNLGAGCHREADVYVFMTQDALLEGEDALYQLVKPILQGEAIGAYGRQLPHQGSTLLEAYTRTFNYPATSQTKTRADVSRLGVKAYFFSNVFSAVQGKAFWDLGGFPSDTIMNEDMAMASRILHSGGTIKYVAEAKVLHSHDYTLQQQFRRNFDVGVFFHDSSALLPGAGVGKEGVRFVLAQIQHVVQQGRPLLAFKVVTESAVKYLAFQLGKRHPLIPLNLKRKFSMHSYHWLQQHR
ncbi:glycosyltransferase family 2 protein [Deinococcus roseus]|uniref:Biofilm formation protein PslC n=1 Tax=Deinococcus roseus TaxID=392414 RepID=A0ABQ2CZ50_9DEIO|nr:glycosyltransferase [Deinococcus roseus]GGJ35357.1 biofilm formation protein PslC [Deinococcus roseus]